MSHPILTPSLRLIPCTLELLYWIIEENDFQLGTALDVSIAPGWSTFGLEPFKWTRDVQAAKPEHEGWLTYLTILDKSDKLIGTCGYKGKPDAEGIVEIGYEIAESYQLRGLASEAALALTKRAFTFPEVNAVLAHTLPEANPSGSVLKKVGFQQIAVVEDPDEGAVWEWRIQRDAFVN